MKTKPKQHTRQYVKTVSRNQVYPNEFPSKNTVQYLKHLKFHTDTKFVDLTLTPNRKDEISKCHLFVVVPWYYTISTKFFKNIHSIQHRIIRDIHYAFKSGKKSMTISKNRYNSKDFKVLDDFGINYKVVKYRVFLRSMQ